jgi:hypothetical protein
MEAMHLFLRKVMPRTTGLIFLAPTFAFDLIYVKKCSHGKMHSLSKKLTICSAQFLSTDGYFFGNSVPLNRVQYSPIMLL